MTPATAVPTMRQRCSVSRVCASPASSRGRSAGDTDAMREISAIAAASPTSVATSDSADPDLSASITESSARSSDASAWKGSGNVVHKEVVDDFVGEPLRVVADLAVGDELLRARHDFRADVALVRAWPCGTLSVWGARTLGSKFV